MCVACDQIIMRLAFILINLLFVFSLCPQCSYLLFTNTGFYIFSLDMPLSASKQCLRPCNAQLQKRYEKCAIFCESFVLL